MKKITKRICYIKDNQYFVLWYGRSPADTPLECKRVGLRLEGKQVCAQVLGIWKEGKRFHNRFIFIKDNRMVEVRES